jgi:S-adenosyl-L-methionine hydrolase (adenosine-forming)
MIVLFTDFGLEDPYVGQLHGVLAQHAPGVPIVDLFHGVPSFDIQAAAYLLASYTRDFPDGSVFLCVIDPGVGTNRQALMIESDDRWYVGPDNGLFSVLARRSSSYKCHAITWRPPRLAPSFHGRDLFAPVAAMLALGERPDSEPTELTSPPGPKWPDDLTRVLYVDHYGNVITGMRASQLSQRATVRIGNRKIAYARVFGDTATGTIFWHENANGLVEIAMNQGNANQALRLELGAEIEIV